MTSSTSFAGCTFQDYDLASATVDPDLVTRVHTPRPVLRRHHTGNVHLAGHNGGVAERAANVGDQSGRHIHDRRPTRVGDSP
jgi:hypothetical protein